MSVTWLRFTGSILLGGDSITAGWLTLADGSTGGWRRDLETLLIAAGIRYDFVGPYNTDSGAMVDKDHFGLGGDTAANAKTAIGAQATAFRPAIVVHGWSANDLGSGTPAATVLDDIDATIDAAQAACAWSRHLVQTTVKPTSPHAYYANIAAYNTAAAALPARVAAQGARLVDVGAPVQGDLLHPDDATGYPAMAAAIYATLVAVLA